MISTANTGHDFDEMYFGGITLYSMLLVEWVPLRRGQQLSLFRMSSVTRSRKIPNGQMSYCHQAYRCPVTFLYVLLLLLIIIVIYYLFSYLP